MVAILDADHAQRLIELRVVPLYIVLQGIGSLVIFFKQGFSDFGNPLVGLATFVGIYRNTRPKGDVIELDRVIVGSAINQRTQFAIAYWQ